ncbi:MAG: radical SAM protein [Clostridium sp.]|nr:radical SAM protein [Clostridium sp.]MCM1397889.1 radical SAM protein [Clostridium sp.]MCM1459128.1 radical SAM protein [Bacteroides sp.]
MKYQPITCVWEVTMGCNMRCGHCGSSCAEPLEGELTTAEALDLCDQIADLGLRWVTLSGGEPLTRKDITQIVKRLSDRGVAVNMITNGLLLDRTMAEQLKENGIATLAISIDGTKEIHDEIRKAGAFDNARRGFQYMKELGIKSGVVTTITNKNMGILGELKEELIRMGVQTWQVQLGLPMGNMKEKPDWLLAPEKVVDIINFCYETAKEGRIKIYPADCIGYYTQKELEIKMISYETDRISLWDGCNAGIRGFGILHDGKILGCTSIREDEFIEKKSIRESSLKEIWENEDAFAWRRKFKKADLDGDCKTCVYGSKCLGGCPNTRLTMNGSIHSENQYCAYNLKLKEMKEKQQCIKDKKGLYEKAEGLIKLGIYQEAAIILERLLELDPKNEKALVVKAYAEYMCGNYEICKEDNAKALEIDKENADALSGYAIALYRLGDIKNGIDKMKNAVIISGGRSDLREDLARMMSAAN